MINIDNLKEIYKSGSLSEVLELCQAETVQSLESKDFEQFVDLVIETSRRLKRTLDFNLYLSLLERAFELKLVDSFSKIQKSIDEKKLTNKEWVELYELRWRAHLSFGEVQAAKKYLLQLSSVFITKGKYSRAFDVLERSLSLLGRDDDVLSYFFLASLSLQNEAVIVSRMKNDAQRVLECKSLSLIKSVNLFIDEYSKAYRDDVKYVSVDLQFIYCSFFIHVLRREGACSEGFELIRRCFIHDLYNLLLVDEYRHKGLLLLLEYALIFRKKRMGQNIILYFEVCRDLKKKYQKRVDELNSEILLMPEVGDDKGFEEESFDFASDLFQKEKTEVKGFVEIKKLERDYNFLIKSGVKTSEVEKIVNRLKEIDPKNSIIEKYAKSINISTDYEDLEGVEGLYQALLANSLRDDVGDHERNMSKVLSLIDDDELEVIYCDIITSMFQMGYYRVTIEIIDRVLSFFGEDSPDTINLMYLKAEAFYALEGYEKVISLCRGALNNLPLAREEKNNFLYLAAESYLLQGKNKHARDLFKQVFNVDSSFRLVAQRVMEIEES